MDREQIINLLQHAIDVVGDVIPAAFGEEEYNVMYNFLEELRTTCSK